MIAMIMNIPITTTIAITITTNGAIATYYYCRRFMQFRISADS